MFGLGIKYSEESSNEQLVKGCKKQDSKAQKVLYDRFAPKMFGVCLGYSKDYHTAKDLLQEGFLKVLLNIKKYGGQGSLEGWIRRVIINHILDFLRQKKSDVEYIELKEQHFLSQNLYQVNGVIETLDTQDFINLIRELANGYRTILNLYYVEKYTHNEIAEKLGISPGTSKSQLSRARIALEKIIYSELGVDHQNLKYGA